MGQKNYWETAAAPVIVERTTGNEITDFSTPVETAVADRAGWRFRTLTQPEGCS